MKPLKLIVFCLILPFAGIKLADAQPGNNPLPRIIEKDGRHALIVDGKPFLILGGQAHNSSAWPSVLPAVWKAIMQMHANTLEVPLYWEQIEPQPGQFNFALVDTLLTQARVHRVRLVLLWFATWKNGSNHYMPAWMKSDAVKYPNITGRKGEPVDSPSPHAAATLDADCKAFAAVMHYLKKTDKPHTVLMVQVENEPGSWGSEEDHSPAAQRLFDAEVPAALLNPGVLKTLNVAVTSSGSWQKVFGERADEYFQAWSVGTFIGKVAAAGKAEYALPLYVNAALRDPLTHPFARNYESGGPTDNVIPIWKVAAPAVDVLAPDIYLTGSERVLKVIDLYNRADNALFVPEAGLVKENARYIYSVIAGGGIGFSPFGVDNDERTSSSTGYAENFAPFSNEYAVLAPMEALLAEWSFKGQIKAVVEHEDHSPQTVAIGDWEAKISFGTGGRSPLNPNVQPIGKLMIVQVGEDKFTLIGTNCRVTFKPIGKNLNRAWEYLKVEEGNYRDGQFKAERILNGDETDWGGPAFGVWPVVRQAALVLR